jgi:hypothetical protein
MPESLLLYGSPGGIGLPQIVTAAVAFGKLEPDRHALLLSGRGRLEEHTTSEPSPGMFANQ